jgi:hypothetical protein
LPLQFAQATKTHPIIDCHFRSHNGCCGMTKGIAREEKMSRPLKCQKQKAGENRLSSPRTLILTRVLSQTDEDTNPGCRLQESTGRLTPYFRTTLSEGMSIRTEDSSPARTVTRLLALTVLPSRTISA